MMLQKRRNACSMRLSHLAVNIQAGATHEVLGLFRLRIANHFGLHFFFSIIANGHRPAVTICTSRRYRKDWLLKPASLRELQASYFKIGSQRSGTVLLDAAGMLQHVVKRLLSE